MSDQAPKAKLIDGEDLEYIRGRYQNRIRTDGVSFKSMNSGTEEKQKIRHLVHGSLISSTDAVLDVGSGIGQFYESLVAQGFQGTYLGIDIVPEYIEYCQKKYAHLPNVRFQLGNIFELGIQSEFDVIVASQVFNARYKKSDNKDVVCHFLRDAFDHARRWVSVDMLTSYADFNTPELFYFSPEAMFSYAKSLTRIAGLRHDYLPFEFCIQLGQQDALGNSWSIKT